MRLRPNCSYVKYLASLKHTARAFLRKANPLALLRYTMLCVERKTFCMLSMQSAAELHPSQRIMTSELPFHRLILSLIHLYF